MGGAARIERCRRVEIGGCLSAIGFTGLNKRHLRLNILSLAQRSNLLIVPFEDTFRNDLRLVLFFNTVVNETRIIGLLSCTIEGRFGLAERALSPDVSRVSLMVLLSEG